MFSALFCDLRLSLRNMARQPGYALVIVLVLGIGIGAVTLMYGTLNTVVLQPLPYEEPERLIWVWSMTEAGRRNTVSAIDYFDYREQCSSFESLAAYLIFRPSALLGGDGEPERIPYTMVSHNFFSSLRVQPQLGRTFAPEEESPESPREVIVSHGFWQRRLGGNTGVIGSALVIDGQPCELVGVMPADFDFPSEVQFWFPMRRDSSYVQNRGNRNFRVFGRLAEGAGIERAQAQASAVALRLGETYPDVDKGWGIRLEPMHEVIFGQYRPAMMILMGAVTLLLLVACANISSLSLARTMTRQNEIAIRFALGAPRRRVVAQLLTESAAIALIGGNLGLLLAGLGIRAVKLFGPPGLPRLSQLGIDHAMLMNVAGISLLAGLLFGVVPALRGTRFGLADSLKESARTTAAGGSLKARSVLVVAQVAMSLMLLSGAGLLIRSFLRLQNVEHGFKPEGLLLAEVQLPRGPYDTAEKRARFFAELQRRFRSLPGIIDAAAAEQLPFVSAGMWNYIYPAERPPNKPEDRMRAERKIVTEGYFSTLGIPILAGRAFTADDRLESPRVVIINKTMAEQFWPAEHPLGRQLVLAGNPGLPMEVVGIAGNVREYGPASDYLSTFYMPLEQFPISAIQVAVRVSGEPQSLIDPLKATLIDLDKNIPIANFHTMESRYGDRIAIPRFRTYLLGVFALISLIMSTMGLYGILAYFVVLRTHEVGIRMALGAGRSRVLLMIVRKGMALVALGAALGLAGGLATARLMSSMLFQTAPTDVQTFAIVTGALLLAALAACLVPARRATAVDPLIALRAE